MTLGDSESKYEDIARKLATLEADAQVLPGREIIFLENREIDTEYINWSNSGNP